MEWFNAKKKKFGKMDLLIFFILIQKEKLWKLIPYNGGENVNICKRVLTSNRTERTNVEIEAMCGLFQEEKSIKLRWIERNY